MFFKYCDFMDPGYVKFNDEGEYENFCKRAINMNAKYPSSGWDENKPVLGATYSMTELPFGENWTDYMSPELTEEQYYTLDFIMKKLDINPNKLKGVKIFNNKVILFSKKFNYNDKKVLINIYFDINTCVLNFAINYIFVKDMIKYNSLREFRDKHLLYGPTTYTEMCKEIYLKYLNN